MYMNPTQDVWTAPGIRHAGHDPSHKLDSEESLSMVILGDEATIYRESNDVRQIFAKWNDHENQICRFVVLMKVSGNYTRQRLFLLPWCRHVDDVNEIVNIAM